MKLVFLTERLHPRVTVVQRVLPLSPARVNDSYYAPCHPEKNNTSMLRWKFSCNYELHWLSALHLRFYANIKTNNATSSRLLQVKVINKAVGTFLSLFINRAWHTYDYVLVSPCDCRGPSGAKPSQSDALLHCFESCRVQSPQFTSSESTGMSRIWWTFTDLCWVNVRALIMSVQCQNRSTSPLGQIWTGF